jgi:hypothetical protein
MEIMTIAGNRQQSQSPNVEQDMKILHINASLRAGSFTYKITEIEVEEKPSTYIVTETKRRISRQAILHIDSNFKENHRHIQRFTYCLEHQRDKAIKLLRNHIMPVIAEIAREVAEVMEASCLDFTERG